MLITSNYMEHLDDWRLYNKKNKLSAKDYVEGNLYRLLQFFEFDDDSSIEEKEQILIDYFTRFPDQIQYMTYVTVGKPNPASAPKLNNIGGVIKYR